MVSLNLNVKVSTNNQFRCLVFFFLACIFLLANCKRKDTVAPEFSIPGNWHVSHYAVASVNHLNDFSGYVFEFKTDSTLVATNASTTETGNWTYNSSTLQFNISIGTSFPLAQINKSWILILKTENELILDEDSTVNDEELHFLKN